MATQYDSTTVLNPGTGGSTMDESSLQDQSGTEIAKRSRIVIGGEQDRSAIVEPRLVEPGQYALPVILSPSSFDALVEIRNLLTEIRDELKRRPL